MFFTLILENENGDRIDLSKTANRFMFSKIDGLNPPAGTISTSSYAGMNGSYLNNAFICCREDMVSASDLALIFQVFCKLRTFLHV